MKYAGCAWGRVLRPSAITSKRCVWSWRIWHLPTRIQSRSGSWISYGSTELLPLCSSWLMSSRPQMRCHAIFNIVTSVLVLSHAMWVWISTIDYILKVIKQPNILNRITLKYYFTYTIHYPVNTFHLCNQFSISTGTEAQTRIGGDESDRRAVAFSAACQDGSPPRTP